MGTRVRKFLLVLCCFIVSIKSKSIHTSGKLDFGETSQAASLVKNEKRFPVAISRQIDSVSSPSELTSNFSCGPTGCNATKNNNSVETEVVVHVQTKVNLDQSQEKKIITPNNDVPIVVGYRGATVADTPDEDRFRNTRPDDIPRRRGNGYPGNDYRPLYTDSPVSIGFPYNQRIGPSTRNHYYGSSTYRPPNSDGYGGSSVTPTPNSFGYYGPPRPQTGFPNNNNYFRSSTATPLDLNNIHPPSPILDPDLNRRNYDYNYKENGVELQIPYFEHTFNRHYFREDPPPHAVWLGKDNRHNPVEFKNTPRNQWRPSYWNGRNHKYAFSDGGSSFMNSYPRNPPISVYNQPSVHYRNHGPECSCGEQRTDDTSEGSNSYAASSVNHRIAFPSKDPSGVSIDDKLAPLN